MIKSKLICLEYPNPDSVNVNDQTSFKRVILWLEDQKIRHYKIDERADLRKVNSDDWNKAFEKYRNDLNCPKELKSELDQLKWICNYAVKLEYLDNRDEYQSVTSQVVKEAQHQSNQDPTNKSTNPFDNLDCKFISNLPKHFH
jgi:RLL motif containing protein 1